ncbi:oxidoreductase [Saccharopolyspora shandongensis]|uniref:oxidoreductase n=1 Tax=Saccharopolyspora shandongensis TaxID=418495 RepID=UPI0033CC9B91
MTPSTRAEWRVEQQARRHDGSSGALEELDVHADSSGPECEIRGEYLTRKLREWSAETTWLTSLTVAGKEPVVIIEDAVITGQLELRAAELPFLLEFVRCRFEKAPDLRHAKVTALVLWHCRFPGLDARNLHTGSDMVLRDCASVGGIVDLADAQLGGSLLLNDSELRNPGRRAIYADRLSVAGAVLGLRMFVSGEIRMPAAKIGGNLTIGGSALRNRGRYALNANGIQIGGSVRCEADPRSRRPFTVAGMLYLPSAHIAGDLRLRDAVLEPGVAAPRRGESRHDDPISSLIADRADIRGDVWIDQGFRSGGTIRMVSARIGGELRMSRAHIDLSWARSAKAMVEQPLRTLHLDGTEIRGNVEAAEVTLRGQVRMIDAHIHGSWTLTQATVIGPRTDVVQASRIIVGNNVDFRDSDIIGSLHLQGAQIGANVDLRSVQLTKPAWHRHEKAYKPSVDLRDARIARDLVCSSAERPFVADGEVQLRRAEIRRHTRFSGSCHLGDGGSHNAINAIGLVTQELTVQPEGVPQGRILLTQGQCEYLADSQQLWAATGGVDIDGLSYAKLVPPLSTTDHRRLRERLQWLRRCTYQPGPYDQLAKVVRATGNEEHAVKVLIAKQRHRYRTIATVSPRGVRPLVWTWSLLQRVTVSYGYRPLRGLIWLLQFAIAGTAWFTFHPLQPVNQEDRPVWDPFLYTVDQLMPIINLGHDVMWQAHGASKWATVILIIAGWVLATTVAAGITRALRRGIDIR